MTFKMFMVLILTVCALGLKMRAHLNEDPNATCSEGKKQPCYDYRDCCGGLDRSLPITCDDCWNSIPCCNPVTHVCEDENDDDFPPDHVYACHVRGVDNGFEAPQEYYDELAAQQE